MTEPKFSIRHAKTLLTLATAPAEGAVLARGGRDGRRGGPGRRSLRGLGRGLLGRAGDVGQGGGPVLQESEHRAQLADPEDLVDVLVDVAEDHPAAILAGQPEQGEEAA